MTLISLKKSMLIEHETIKRVVTKGIIIRAGTVSNKTAIRNALIVKCFVLGIFFRDLFSILNMKK
jgi:hypothetical protein